jgi:hypothetical protein
MGTTKSLARRINAIFVKNQFLKKQLFLKIRATPQDENFNPFLDFLEKSRFLSKLKNSIIIFFRPRPKIPLYFDMPSNDF